ncbi:LPS biosynthesis protein [Clostridium acetobutylicum]|nr:LPS biosynthesis protein [Clostridium acetobutylicum]
MDNKLIILDDYFPNPLTGFRVAEFNYYMTVFPNCYIYSMMPYESYTTFYNQYAKIYPQFKDRIKFFADNIQFNCSLFYTVFAGNASYFLKYFEREATPFVFTLYPGGRFSLSDLNCKNNLIMVCSSKFFKKVIVTQEISYKYLIDNNITTSDKIEYIYGYVDDSKYFFENYKRKLCYPQDKQTFDICFVAGKYTSKGIDKGYDSFVEICKRLSKISDQFRFHVVGGFSSSDIDVSDIKDRMKFYGYKQKEFFPEFYSHMDIVIAPTVPFLRGTGEFDGFPTGCAVEAGMSGTAVFCTDFLKLNRSFIDGVDIIILDKDIGKTVSKIIYYKNNPIKLYELSQRGRIKFLDIFNIDQQMMHRVNLLKSFM